MCVQLFGNVGEEIALELDVEDGTGFPVMDGTRFAVLNLKLEIA